MGTKSEEETGRSGTIVKKEKNIEGEWLCLFCSLFFYWGGGFGAAGEVDSVFSVSLCVE